MRMPPKSTLRRYMTTWWNSLDTVSTLSTFANFAVAVLGVLVFVLGKRENELESRAQSEAERQRDEQISANNQTLNSCSSVRGVLVFMASVGVSPLSSTGVVLSGGVGFMAWVEVLRDGRKRLLRFRVSGWLT